MDRKFSQILSIVRSDNGQIRIAKFNFKILDNAINDSLKLLKQKPNLVKIDIIDKETNEVIWTKEAK